MVRRRGFSIVALSAALAFLVACAGIVATVVIPEYRRSQDKQLVVVATSYPLYEAVALIGGKRVHAVNLQPLDPYAPLTKKQRATLGDASLVVKLSNYAQPHIDDELRVHPRETLEVLSQSPMRSERSPWQDPQTMWEIAEQVRASLSQRDLAGASLYAKNARKYARTIVRVDKDLARWLSSCKRHEIVTTTDAITLLNRRYGLEQRVVRFDPARSDSRETVKTALNNAQSDVLYMSYLPQLNEAKTIRDELGARVVAINSGAARTDQAMRSEIDYASTMTLNLDALRTSLDCAPRWKERK